MAQPELPSSGHISGHVIPTTVRVCATIRGGGEGREPQRSQAGSRAGALPDRWVAATSRGGTGSRTAARCVAARAACRSRCQQKRRFDPRQRLGRRSRRRLRPAACTAGRAPRRGRRRRVLGQPAETAHRRSGISTGGRERQLALPNRLSRIPERFGYVFRLKVWKLLERLRSSGEPRARVRPA